MVDDSKFMVLQPPYSSSILPDGSGDYHIDVFEDEKEALDFCEAARRVSSVGLAKKIKCIRYVDINEGES